MLLKNQSKIELQNFTSIVSRLMWAELQLNVICEYRQQNEHNQERLSQPGKRKLDYWFSGEMTSGRTQFLR